MSLGSSDNYRLSLGHNRGRILHGDKPYQDIGTLNTPQDCRSPTITLAQRMVRAWSMAGMGNVCHSDLGPDLASGDEEEVRHCLTYLKMRHDDDGFRPLAEAFHAAFPELSLEFQHKTKMEYEPVFVPKAGGTVPVNRNAIGAGAWAYLALLAAARAAHVKGAKWLLLDEPHLYLHPGLEREATRHLTDAAAWANRPLQIIAATHSPEFVRAAMETGGTVHLVHWTDRKHEQAQVTPITQPVKQLGVSAVEVLYSARRSVFAEGKSDVDTFEVLAPGYKHNKSYFPLNHPDNTSQQPFMNALRAVSTTIARGHCDPPLLILDGDKRSKLEEEWYTWGLDDPTKTMKVEFVGLLNSDLESWFCVSDLVAEFVGKERGSSLDAQEQQDLGALLAGPLLGCKQLDAAFLRFLNRKYDKVKDLPELARLFVANRATFPKVEQNVAGLVALLEGD